MDVILMNDYINSKTKISQELLEDIKKAVNSLNRFDPIFKVLNNCVTFYDRDNIFYRDLEYYRFNLNTILLYVFDEDVEDMVSLVTDVVDKSSVKTYVVPIFLNNENYNYRYLKTILLKNGVESCKNIEEMVDELNEIIDYEIDKRVF